MLPRNVKRCPMNAVQLVGSCRQLDHWQQRFSFSRWSLHMEQQADQSRHVIWDRSVRHVATQNAARCDGARPCRHLYTRTAVLCVILCCTGSLYNSRNTGCHVLSSPSSWDEPSTSIMYNLHSECDNWWSTSVLLAQSSEIVWWTVVYIAHVRFKSDVCYFIALTQGSNFCSSAGFEALKKRTRDGRRTCKMYAEYLRSRLCGVLVTVTKTWTKKMCTFVTCVSHAQIVVFLQLSYLHWLPVPVHYQIKFKISTLTYKTLATCQPSYLHNLLHVNISAIMSSPFFNSTTSPCTVYVYWFWSAHLQLHLSCNMELHSCLH